MAVYRFRVTFEDFDDIQRDIEIRSTQTFEELNSAINAAIGFDASKPASFYMSDDYWKKGKEITTRDLKAEEKERVSVMKKTRMCDLIIDPHQKIYYVFDFSSPWTFHVELFKIVVNEEAGVSYPRCIKVTGEAPKQYGVTNLGAVPEPEDFDEGIALLDLEEDLPEGTEGEELVTTSAEGGEEGAEMGEADDELIDEEGGAAADGDEF